MFVKIVGKLHSLYHCHNSLCSFIVPKFDFLNNLQQLKLASTRSM